MCLCNGTGQVVIDHGWGHHVAPCPDTACEYDKSASIKAFDEKAEALLAELDKLEGVTA